MSQDSSESVWPIDINLDAFERIVADHFCIGVRRYSLLSTGSYAKVYLFILEDDLQAVGRVVYPVRETVKTEAEVGAMTLVRSRTNVPVPQVYLYSSSTSNPVGAEWILMEYLPGEPLGDCFRTLAHQQKLRTSTDLAGVMSALFSITSSCIGSLLLQDRFNDDSTSALRYPSARCSLRGISYTQTDQFRIGPLNDITFLDYPAEISPELCGPFDSEFEFLEAFAFLGRPPTRPNKMLEHWTYEKVFEVYHVIRPLYRGFAHSTSDRPDETFHFAHGDLSSWNILVDPKTGAITGVVDWEMAGFRPAWLAAVTAGWFDDDSNRFLMTDDQECRLGYEVDTTEDKKLRSHFRLQLAERNIELFRHYWLGPELRAFFYACSQTYAGNAEVWLQRYEKHEWDVKRRGPFPFDFMAWILEKLLAEKTLRATLQAA